MTTQTQSPVKKRTRPFKKILFGIGLVIGSFIFALVLIGIFKETPEESIVRLKQEQLVNESERSQAFSDNAYAMSQVFLKQRLKSPSTANFPGAAEVNNYIGDSTFNIRSYVDSQNGFGAMIRSNYSATIKYTGLDNWELVTIKIEE